MRILLLAIGFADSPLREPDFLKLLKQKGHKVQVRRINEARSYLHVAQAFLLAKDIADFDLIITQEYFCSFGVCLRATISRATAKIAVIGFNVSRRYLITPLGPINTAINWIFGRLSIAVVHSRAERLLFSQIHGLDLGHIALALWGFDIPQSLTNGHSKQEHPVNDRRYICMIGRNNRDFVTLKEAIHGTGIPAIFIASRVTDPDLKSCDQIKVLYDIPFDDCLQVIRGSAFSVLLLKDGNRGAGHITAVSAMMLGKAHVFSDADVLSDYLISGRHGIAVPLGDAAAVKNAIVKLYNDEELAGKCGIEAKEYALTYLTNAAFQERLFALLDATLEGRPIDAVDPAWCQVLDEK